ncbi:unnamed protein product [Schistosoma turkestanicum]|nr:unnamed protein product [Schistosoma turkestanicum]
MTLICLLIFTCLCYRIIDYFNRHEMMKSLFVYNKFHVSKKTSDKNMHNNENNNLLSLMPEDEQNLPEWFTITLCNLNPIRGSALFAVENGSEIYDNISKNRQHEIDFNGLTKRVNVDNTFVSKAILKRTGHKLNEMLKFCFTGNEQCTHRNFTSVLTIYGQCYRMKLEPSIHEVRIVLDSQDYDYIIPHRGLIGFRLWIHSNEQQASYMLDLKEQDNRNWKYTQHENVPDLNSLQQQQQLNIIRPNEIIVSTEFQTLIRVALDMNVHYKQTNMKTGLCSTSMRFTECEQNVNRNSDSLEDTIWSSDNDNRHFSSARIVSATQSSKATIMYSLLALRNPNLFMRNNIDLQRGLRIQQRAYIQLTNETAFNELRNLVTNYDDLRNQLRSIKQLLHEIQIGIWRDQREALQGLFKSVENNPQLCTSQIQIHIDSIYNVKLERLGEAIATCLQRLELFQTSMNLIIKWNKHILQTFSIDYEHLQKVDEKSLVAFTVQFETIGNDISMTHLTPMHKIFNPFGEIMGICFGTLSLLIPLYLIVDYFFTMKCKSSKDRQGVI